ncbi:hypothetical protein EMIT079MI2_410006 [Bacillus sp. IT-79MI2]
MRGDFLNRHVKNNTKQLLLVSLNHNTFNFFLKILTSLW